MTRIIVRKVIAWFLFAIGDLALVVASVQLAAVAALYEDNLTGPLWPLSLATVWLSGITLKVGPASVVFPPAWPLFLLFALGYFAVVRKD